MSELRPMQNEDTKAVLAIIDDFDEDDRESAGSFFEQEGVDNHFVLEEDGAVIGVSGFTHVPASERTSWLSWTYLAESSRGAGKGRQMVSGVIDRLRQMNCRKLFVKVSDYCDPEDGQVYLPALKLYQSLGFVLELTGEEFYDEGENQLILGLSLESDDDQAGRPQAGIKEERPAIQFRTAYEIADSDGAYSFEWYTQSKLTLFKTSSFSAEDLSIGLDAVRQAGGRKVFLTFPSNLPLIREPLQAAGFELAGKLQDYYEPGLDELHYTHCLT